MDALTLVAHLHLLRLCDLAVHRAQQECPLLELAVCSVFPSLF